MEIISLSAPFFTGSAWRTVSASIKVLRVSSVIWKLRSPTYPLKHFRNRSRLEMELKRKTLHSIPRSTLL